MLIALLAVPCLHAQIISTNSGNTGSTTCTTGSFNIVSGDTVWYFATTSNSGDTFGTPASSQVSGTWTEVSGFPSTNSTLISGLWYATATSSSSSGTVHVVTSGGTTNGTSCVGADIPLLASSPVDQVVKATFSSVAAGTAFSCGAATITPANEVILGFVAATSGSTANYEQVGQWTWFPATTAGNTGVTTSLIYSQAGAAGTYTPQFENSSVTQTGVCWTVTLTFATAPLMSIVNQAAHIGPTSLPLTVPTSGSGHGALVMLTTGNNSGFGLTDSKGDTFTLGLMSTSQGPDGYVSSWYLCNLSSGVNSISSTGGSLGNNNEAYYLEISDPASACGSQTPAQGNDVFTISLSPSSSPSIVAFTFDCYNSASNLPTASNTVWQANYQNNIIGAGYVSNTSSTTATTTSAICGTTISPEVVMASFFGNAALTVTNPPHSSIF